MSPIYTPGKLTLAKTFTWNETVWNPSMVETELWLDAADNTTVFSDAGTTQAIAGTSTIQQWNDKSGKGRHVSQTDSAKRPSYATNKIGGKVAIDWGNSVNSKNLLRSSMQYSPARYFGVAQYTGPNPFPQWCSVVIHNYTGSPDLFTGFAGATTWFGDGSFFIKTFFDGSSVSTNTALPAVLNPFIFATDYTKNTNRTDVYIGNDRDTAGRSWIGVMSEIIATTSVPSTLVKQKIEGYLAHKWGLTANLPSDHPYKTVGPTP